MLNQKIKHADHIEVLSMSRRSLKNGKRPNLSNKVGRKKNMENHLLVKRLKAERVLDTDCNFVESITNDWFTDMSLYARHEESRVLGNKPALDLYLALVINGNIARSRAVKDLGCSQSAVYSAIKSLEAAGMISVKRSILRINESHGMFKWMKKYLFLSVVYADMKKSLVPLFDCVPGCIDGPQAHLKMNYESGWPIRAADMIIRTGPLFEPFWIRVVQTMEYFARYPRKVDVRLSDSDMDVEWLDGLPYNKNAGEAI